MPFVRETARVGGKEIIVETGKWAKQAGGSVVVRCGDSMVLVTASGSPQPRDIDFMPLTCEYRENFYSSGKIPGSFFRREGRSTNEEILICRLMDRPVRPLFPKGWFIDTQIIANVVSFELPKVSRALSLECTTRSPGPARVVHSKVAPATVQNVKKGSFINTPERGFEEVPLMVTRSFSLANAGVVERLPRTGLVASMVSVAVATGEALPAASRADTVIGIRSTSPGRTSEGCTV